ncbi:MAG TPA: hypothetical protein VGE13_00525 [Candidatus Saccharimonadales bacterium]
MQETEVRETTTQDGDTTVRKQAVARSQRTPGIIAAQRAVWFIVGLINIIIALRFVFLLLGANRGAAFTDLVYSISAPFVAPFVGIFGEPTYGRSVFELSSVLAIVIYLLIGWGIVKLLTIAGPRDTI